MPSIVIERDEISFDLTFGMRRESFDWICALVSQHWAEAHHPIGVTSRFQLREWVAVTIYYLTHCSSLEHTAGTFDMTTTTATRYVWQVVDVLLSDVVKTQYFNFPTSVEGWNELSDGFEAICGFPNCCLAIGGMLVEIERPRQWRMVLQQTFTSRERTVGGGRSIQSEIDGCSTRGITDKETLRYSRFGRNLAQIIPEEKHIIGHERYSLSKFVVVPYPETSTMSASERLFNSLQTTTQRVVKRTAEMIKKRFRILQSPLRQKTEDGDAAMTKMAQVISSSIVLHNVLVDLDDLVEADSSLRDDTDEEDMESDSDSEDSDVDESIDEVSVTQGDRVKAYLYVNRDHILHHFG